MGGWAAPVLSDFPTRRGYRGDNHRLSYLPPTLLLPRDPPPADLGRKQGLVIGDGDVDVGEPGTLSLWKLQSGSNGVRRLGTSPWVAHHVGFGEN